ncbi:branched-chain-amino-acid aminotransferase: cytosolic-like protein [Leptotrombidium deliense]|uniref:Branched-chain-amino-acid aminotransferase: cytosolic-like protein n=1 Tax=Leptotrombidium deliense TaxID=299467 RepID=A0A443S784_9ACAR|nr:branched-chain-amino-acid aminotransferase: cytosolic-like protein [Leptotrombidium deliense]
MSYKVVYPYTCEVKYSNGKWSKPKIISKHETSVELNSFVLSYGNNIIDGLKAYKGVDGKIRTFRPDYKYSRFSYGARRSNIPVVPRKSFYKCLKLFVEKVNNQFPEPETNGSIYMRQNLFETSIVSDSSTKSATFHVYGSKVPMPMFAGESPTVCLRVETIRSKNENTSLAYVKSGANYAITYLPEKMSLEKGCPSTLWLYKGNICDMSVGNVWMVLQKDGQRILVTPPAEYILIPGAIRDAIFTVAHEKGFKTAEALISIDSVKEMVKSEELLEMFTSGHYADITPLTNIFYGDEEIEIPTLDQEDPIYLKIWHEMYSLSKVKRFDSFILRSIILGTNNQIDMIASTAMFAMIVLPSDENMNTKQTVSARVETFSTRHYEGNLRNVRTSINYVPTLLPDRVSELKGYSTTLWLNNGNIVEFSSGNIFFVTNSGDEKIVNTPPRKSIIFIEALRSIVLEIAEQKNFETVESLISIQDLKEMVNNGTLLEMFTVQQNGQIAGVTEIRYFDEDIQIPYEESDSESVYLLLKKEVNKLCYGQSPMDVSGVLWSID